MRGRCVALHVITWGCQMNVYDSARMADVLAPLGYAPVADAGRRRHGDPQHLPHPRQGGREGVLRTRPAAPAEGAARGGRRAHDPGRRRLRGAGRGRRDPGPRALRGHRARAADLSPAAGDGGARRARRRRGDRDRFPGRGQVRLPARRGGAAGRHRVPDHPGRLRQVLQLLRRALHARRRTEPPGRRGAGRGAASGGAGRARDHAARARTSTPGTARRRTARPGASAACCANWPRSAGPAAAALRHLASARHGRRR